MENCLCCIEEPEIHLHPTLQREFIKFLIEETSNQYLISTHSSTFINAHVNMPPKIAEQMQVFHIQLKDGATMGYPVLEGAQSLLALNDLGVRASDILQTNCVIWVEGPSDRIYLNHWLSLIAPDLIEGLHYSVMFYGGRLLSHLSLKRQTEEEKVPEELVEILRINQHSIVVMDSDRKKPRAQINATKRRVRDECEASDGICWVTDGREVENYLPTEMLVAAFPELNGYFAVIGEYESFDEHVDEACHKARIKPKKYGDDKVGYARKLIQNLNETHIKRELRQQLDKVVTKIREWNS